MVLPEVPLAQPLHPFSVNAEAPGPTNEENVRKNLFTMDLDSSYHFREYRAIQQQLHEMLVGISCLEKNVGDDGESNPVS